MNAYDSRLRRVVGGTFWLSLYVALSLTPLLVAFVYRDHPPRDFWTEFSVALGFVALAMIGLQFAITARFRHIAAPYGIDIVLRFHRQISILAVAVAVAHPLILFATREDTLALLNVLTAPWRARFAVAGDAGASRPRGDLRLAPAAAAALRALADRPRSPRRPRPHLRPRPHRARRLVRGPSLEACCCGRP